MSLGDFNLWYAGYLFGVTVMYRKLLKIKIITLLDFFCSYLLIGTTD